MYHAEHELSLLKLCICYTVLEARDGVMFN